MRILSPGDTFVNRFPCSWTGKAAIIELRTMRTPGRTMIARRLLTLASVTLGLAICGAAAAGPAAADVTVKVNTSSDAPQSDQCSLREAFSYANGTAEPSCATGTPTGTITIVVPAGCYESPPDSSSWTGRSQW